jgi:hypothetical protein
MFRVRSSLSLAQGGKSKARKTGAARFGDRERHGTQRVAKSQYD